MDFGKEGAAVLSSLISALGFCAQLLSLRLLPRLQRAHGWHAVFATLAGLGVVAASAMSLVMLADQRKYARGYIIRSSLLNETIVTLHACGRESCSHLPMWAPGARREWATPQLRRASIRPYAPTRYCHQCGRKQLLEVRVGRGLFTNPNPTLTLTLTLTLALTLTLSRSAWARPSPAQRSSSPSATRLPRAAGRQGRSRRRRRGSRTAAWRPGGGDGSRGDTALTRRGGVRRRRRRRRRQRRGRCQGYGCERRSRCGSLPRDGASRAYPQPNRSTVTAALSSAVSTQASRD